MNTIEKRVRDNLTPTGKAAWDAYSQTIRDSFMRGVEDTQDGVFRASLAFTFRMTDDYGNFISEANWN